MKVTTTGQITMVFEKRQGTSKATGKAWATQDFGFVEFGTQDPVIFNIFGEDIISNVNLKVGDEIKVTLDVRSREYNGRWYSEVRFVECEKLNDENAVASKSAPEVAPATDDTAAINEADMPF